MAPSADAGIGVGMAPGADAGTAPGAEVGTVWLMVVAVAVVSLLLRAAAPLLLGDRELPPRVRAALVLSGPALVAALVLTLLWPHADAGPDPVRDWTRAAGVAVGAALLLARRSIVTAMVAAAVVAALTRLALG